LFKPKKQEISIMAHQNFRLKSVGCLSIALSLLFLCGGVFSPVYAGGIITTVAGNGVQSFSGDGGLATAAAINLPTDVDFDSNGNLYIADWGNHRIRKADTAGVISTVAGNGVTYSGSSGFSGDGGPATAAQLNHPFGTNFDSIGNLYIADQYNHRIRKVDTAGIISTIAGSGPVGEGNGGFSGDGGPAITARLNYPKSVAFDSVGNLYIADSKNGCIRKVDTAGIISTVAIAGLYYPSAVVFDSNGNLYVANSGYHLIRKVDTAAIISTVAGRSDIFTGGFTGDGVPAAATQLNWPYEIAFDSVGNLYIADSGNHRIRKVDTAGIISTVAGNGVTSYGTSGFSGDGGAATAAQLNNPIGVAVDSSDNL
jgi:trimeric autotransporter adhesin